MEYFYGAAFFIILISLIATITGLAKPNRFTLCGFHLGMLLIVLSGFIESIQ
jgi:ABC-type Fe3+-siderophore transport system permease subunit